MTADSEPRQPRLVVAPERPSLDTELHMRLEDLPAGTRVTLRASLRDPPGLQWHSWSTFRAAEVAALQVERLRVPDGLARTEVREGGLVGTLYCPDAGHRLPGVLLLGGAEGGMHEDDAALLAAHGYAALALAYCGAPGLPVTQQEVPLEYFGKALDFLGRHPGVQPDRLAVQGASKGGEAALLVGATFPQVRAVVSVVGSGLVTQADRPARGRHHPGGAHRWRRPAHLQRRRPGLRHGVPPGRRRPARRPRPPHAWRHLVYPGAGHNIAAPPYAPTTRSLSPGPGVLFTGGETPAGDARPRAGAWQKTLQFLSDELGP